MKRSGTGSLNFNRRRRHFDPGRMKGPLILLGEISAVLFLAFLLVWSFGTYVTCLGDSMDPTVLRGDKCLIDRVAYRIREPERDDIVSFLPAGNLNAEVSVKRIAGVPGDTIQIRNGALFVNGEVKRDSLSSITIEDPGTAANPIHLGRKEYFLLGDNRNQSEDSRFETIGLVTEDEITGKLWFILSPDNFGLVQ